MATLLDTELDLTADHADFEPSADSSPTVESVPPVETQGDSILENVADNVRDNVPATSDSDFWPRGSSKTTEIQLGGTKVKVRTDATPASLRQIRELVEEKYTEFADKLEKGVSTHQLAVLVAFNLAEELLKERERNRVLKKKTVEWAERLLDRVESHLSNNS